MKKTKDLPLLKRVAAKMIHAMQLKLISMSGNLAFKLYYKLAKLHYRLHYGEKLAIGSEHLPLAAKRHVRIFLKANPMIVEEGGETLSYYTESARQKFILNIKLM
jgi:hypothetical protein